MNATRRPSPADDRPLVAVTLGDPAGIGPEIVAKAFQDQALYRLARPLAIGSQVALARALRLTGATGRIRPVERPSDGIFQPGQIDLLPVGTPGEADIQPGRVQAAAGQAAYGAMAAAIKLAMGGEVEAIATAPINKAALQAAGVPYLDHTAMLRDLAASPDLLTMFVLPGLKIFFLARHMSLRDSIAAVTADNIVRTLQQVEQAMTRFGQPGARIGVAALNPHAGEDGLFGREEIEHIRPGIEQARALGIDAVGPVPADALFHLTRQGRFDAALSLFHDQGHIAAKTLDFERTVAVTVGLPFVRTSVDHGTAYDIAGQGRASAVSMLESIKVAAEYAIRQRTAGTSPALAPASVGPRQRRSSGGAHR